MTTAASPQSEPASERLPFFGIILHILRNSTLQGLAGAILVTGVILLARSYGWLHPVELLVYDKLVEAWSRPAASDRVTLVGMTEPDIRRWSYPFNDEVLANLLERLAAAHPRVIGVDIYRDMPVPPGTDKLTAVLKNHPEIIWVFKLAEGTSGQHPEIPPPPVLKGTDQVALADIVTDPGEIARRGLLYADDGKDNYTGLGLALALGYLARDHILPEAGPDDSLKLGKAVFPPLDDKRGPYLHLDNRGYQILLDYRGGAQPYHRVSVSDIIDKDLSSLVRDRVIIVGDTLESVKDSFATPFSTGFSTYPPDYGIEIHAHLAEQIIRMAQTGEKLLTGLPRTGEAAWIFVWALAGAVLGLSIRHTTTALAGGAIGVTAMGGIVYVAFGYGLLLPALPAALAWAGAAGLTNQVLYAASNRARARLRDSFEHYLPPVVIERMMQEDTPPHLGGERREISVLFTDIAGFTTFSESMDPAALAALTNDYFEGVCGAIFNHHGLVNAYIGDSVLAFFNAPLSQPDHVDCAIAAALAIDKFTTRFKAEQAEKGIEFGHTRIGVHTGVAFVGNIGSSQRLQYTALGDMLNTGSRLEGLNKAIGTRLCVSGAIARKAERHRCRPIGEFVVKGRTEGTEVFAPIDPEILSPEWVARYEEAFHAASACRPEAAEMFAALYAENPNDACVAFHHRRLAAGEVGTAVHMDEK